MSDVVRIMKFTWHARVSAEEAEMIIGLAQQRRQRRWRIKDLTGRFILRNVPAATGVVELTWTYGPVHGGRPDDGRKFIERVLNDAWGRPLARDLRSDYPDVSVLEQGEQDFADVVPQFAGG